MYTIGWVRACGSITGERPARVASWWESVVGDKGGQADKAFKQLFKKLKEVSGSHSRTGIPFRGTQTG